MADRLYEEEDIKNSVDAIRTVYSELGVDVSENKYKVRDMKNGILGILDYIQENTGDSDSSSSTSMSSDKNAIFGTFTLNNDLTDGFEIISHNLGKTPSLIFITKTGDYNVKSTVGFALGYGMDRAITYYNDVLYYAAVSTSYGVIDKTDNSITICPKAGFPIRAGEYFYILVG